MHRLIKHTILTAASVLMAAFLPFTALADTKTSSGGPGVAKESEAAEETAPEIPQEPEAPGPVVYYSGYFSGNGWSAVRENGAPLNTSGTLEAVSMRVENVDGGISYRVYLQRGGWQPWTADGEAAGLPDEGNIVEAIEVRLTGNVAQHLDVYYSTTLSSQGTLGWSKNGQASGSIGYGYPIQDFQVKLTAKIGEAPGSTDNRIISIFQQGFQEVDGVRKFLYDDGTPHNGWMDYEDGNRYYIMGGDVLTGWQYLDGMKFYFDENGALVQDLNPIIGIQPSYQIRINKQMNCLTVYTKDGDNGYIVPVKAMLCSTGDDTPLGTFYTPEKYRWQLMVNDTWTQYATRIKAGAGFLIHSICYEKPDNMTLLVDGYNYLGINKSLGCVRLVAANAKWIYDNCRLGTEVVIYEDPVPGPFYKPTVTPIPWDQTWDPTDPNINIAAES